jgi:hypothetical protein
MEVGEPPMTPQLFFGKLGEPPPQQLTAAAESSSLQRERERKKERNKSLLAGRKL